MKSLFIQRTVLMLSLSASVNVMGAGPAPKPAADCKYTIE